MRRSWSILYRGPLSSCNYECGYCPFAKTRNTREELRDDEVRLKRFTNWVRERSEEIGILFTPWGEALPHTYYQKALCTLSHLENVRRVAIQTNLSCRLDWIAAANPTKLALWCTFHPSQTTLDRFLRQCRELDLRRIRYSVGIVGARESFAFLPELRARLPSQVYVWINAMKREPDYYTAKEIAMLSNVDPLFPINNKRHPSLGQACRTGDTVFSVDGNGDMRRCHFVKTVIGNIYEQGFENALHPRVCPVETCGCHIGYVHLESLQLDTVFADGLLERIPEKLPA
ncbi:MAG: Radical protein [Pedosphaera sp.]|nr:Radical protein [Pedosphaera sp.]